MVPQAQRCMPRCLRFRVAAESFPRPSGAVASALLLMRTFVRSGDLTHPACGGGTGARASGNDFATDFRYVRFCTAHGAFDVRQLLAHLPDGHVVRAQSAFHFVLEMLRGLNCCAHDALRCVHLRVRSALELLEVLAKLRIECREHAPKELTAPQCCVSAQWRLRHGSSALCAITAPWRAAHRPLPALLAECVPPVP